MIRFPSHPIRTPRARHDGCKTRLAVIAWILLLALSACASTPGGTLDAYVQAAQADDPDAAYELLSPSVKERLSKAGFLVQWPDIRKDFRHLGRVDNPEVRYTARLKTDMGIPVSMRFDGTRWLFSEGALPPVLRRTPEEAVQVFIYAMRTKNYELVRTLVPANQRDNVTTEALKADHDARGKEITLLLTALEKLDGEAYHVRAKSAFAVYGDREIVFALEAGEWVIVDVEKPLQTVPR